MWFFEIIALCFLIFVLNFKKSKYKLPPGPPCIPLFGSLLSIFWEDAKFPGNAFGKLATKYGPIFSLQIGPLLKAVVITSNEKCFKALSTEALQSRIDESDIWFREKSNYQDLGLFFSNTDFWSKTQSYTHKILRKYGFAAKSRTESIVMDEVLEYCQSLKDSMTGGHVTFDVKTQFESVYFNITWSILTGKSYKLDDAGTLKILQTMNAVTRGGKFGAGVAQLIPKLNTVFPNFTGFTVWKQQCAAWRQTYLEVLQNVREEGDYLQDPHSFLHEYLQKVDQSRDSQSGIFTESNLVAVLQDLALGGTDTQARMTKFLIRYLIQYPGVQVKLQEEVDRVIGHNRRVNIDDIPKLIYLQATLQELYRLVRVTPVLQRKLLQDWEFEGYTIPKGTAVMINVWTANVDASVFKNPNVFQPERFITPQGNIANTEKILAFGSGKRRCIGEQQAKTSMSLIVATLMQEFSFHEDPVSGFPSEGIEQGFAIDPAPFSTLIRARALS